MASTDLKSKLKSWGQLKGEVFDRPYKIEVVGEYLTIENKTPHFSYQIEMSSLRTSAQLLGWIFHLCEKNWVTTEMIRELINKVVDINKVQIIF